MYPVATLVGTLREPLLPRETENTVVEYLPRPSTDLDIAIGYPVHEGTESDVCSSATAVAVPYRGR